MVLWLTLPNHIWQNALPAYIRKLEISFFIKIKRDRITSLHGIHEKYRLCNLCRCSLSFFTKFSVFIPQVSLDPPIKQGQTRYPFLIVLFQKDDETTLELTLSE